MGGQAGLELNTPDAPPEGVPAPASVSSLTFLIHDLAATLSPPSLPAIAPARGAAASQPVPRFVLDSSRSSPL